MSLDVTFFQFSKALADLRNSVEKGLVVGGGELLEGRFHFGKGFFQLSLSFL